MTIFRGTFLVFVLAFVVRVAYIFLASGDLADAAEMEFAAANLAREGSIANVFSSDSGPRAHISPGYAVVLAGVYCVFDYGTPECRRAQQFIAAFISSLTIALIPGLGRRLRLYPASGWLAGIALAISPLYWFDEVTGSWDQPFAGLLIVTIVWLFAALHEEHWRRLRTIILCGLVVGWLALTTPTLLLVPFLICSVELLRGRGERLHLLSRGLVLFAVAALVVAPWFVRNYRIFGAFVPFRSNFGLEMWIGNNPKANGKSCVTHWKDSKSPFFEMHPIGSAAERAHLKQVGEWAYMQEKRKLAQEWIAANPGRWCYLTLRRFYLYWLAPPEVFEPGTSIIPVRTALFVLTTITLFLGLIRLARTGHPMVWLLIATIVGGAAIYMVMHVEIRYRYSVFGVSVLVGCDWIVSAVRGLRRGTSAFA